MVQETVDNIIAGTVKPIPQESLLTTGEVPTPAPKIFKDTCRIDWNRDAESLYNHIRGLSPYPAAWTELVCRDGRRLQVKVFETQEPQTCGPENSGDIVTAGKAIVVKCGNEALPITQLQLSGKKRMSAPEFLRGFDISGAHFE